MKIYVRDGYHCLRFIYKSHDYAYMPTSLDTNIEDWGYEPMGEDYFETVEKFQLTLKDFYANYKYIL